MLIRYLYIFTLLFSATFATRSALASEIETDLLIVGGDESACACAVQAARMGVRRITLVSDIDWLGGQFATQGIGPIDEWTIVEGKRTEFPASGAFLEILEQIRKHNHKTYGIAHPGNGWCGSHTIEPKAAAAIFDTWLQPYREQIQVHRNYEPTAVLTADHQVLGVNFRHREHSEKQLTVRARLTVDSSDWGDVIRLSGASYMAGPDLKSKFNEPSAPESLDPGGHQEMNPISWCPVMREAEGEQVIDKPVRYDARSFADVAKARLWVDWDGSGGIYNFAGWSVYTHRRLIDRMHFHFAPGSETIVLNWPAQDYPLSTLPQHVIDALEKDEPGASQKNIVDMTSKQRDLIFADAKQRALEFVYWLQADAPKQQAHAAKLFRGLRLVDDFGTPDHLPPKPYIREGLRLDAMTILREHDVRTESDQPLWAKTMVPDGVFGYQFNMDFHPTRRQFVNDDTTQAWQPKFFGARNWNAHTDRAMFPLRGLIPVKMKGLLGCSKNIGVTSMVQSSLRLHGQMMHVGTAVGTVASVCLDRQLNPSELANDAKLVEQIQKALVRGAGGGYGLLIWPWHDVHPNASYFEAANMLTLQGVWRADADSVTFKPNQTVRRKELQESLYRLCQRFPETNQGKAVQVSDDHSGEEPVTWKQFGELMREGGWSVFPALFDTQSAKHPLTRAECVDFLYRLSGQSLSQAGNH